MRRPTAFAALRWTLAGGFLQRVVGFVGLGVVARLLARQPEGEAVFGAYQQLVSLHLVVTVVLPLGFDQLLVRETEQRARYRKALAVALAGTWLVSGVALIACAGPLARALDLRAAAPLMWAVPLVLAIQCVKFAIKPLLVAEMDFRHVAAAELANTICVFGGGAALLAVWPTAAALYFAYAGGELIEAAALWRGRALSELLRDVRDFAAFRELWMKHRRFCTVLTADQGLNSFSANSPALLLGGLLGSGAVGLFGMANRLIGVPIQLLIGAVGRITLPALSGRTEEELQERVLLTLRVSAACIPPLILWLMFEAPAVTTIVLGEEWSAQATPILQWLGLSVMLQALFSPISVIDVIRDRPEVTLAWNAANLIVRAAVLFATASLGVVGALAWFSIASAAMWFVYGLALAWLLRAGQARFFGMWARYIPFWGLLALAWWGIAQIPNTMVMLVVSPLPLAAYGVFLLVADKPVARVLRKTLLGHKE